MMFLLGINLPDMSIAMSCSHFHGFSLFSISLLAHHDEGGKTNCRKGGSSKGGGVDGVQVAYTTEENNSSWHCWGEGYLVRKIWMCASLDACTFLHGCSLFYDGGVVDFVGYVAQARLQLLFKMHQGAGILFAQEARVLQCVQKDPLNLNFN